MIFCILVCLGGPLVNTVGFQWVFCVGCLTVSLSMLAATVDGVTNVTIFLFFGVGLTCFFDHFRGVTSEMSTVVYGVGYIVILILLSPLSGYFGGNLGRRGALTVYSVAITVVTFFCALSLRLLETKPLTEKEVEEAEQTDFALNLHLGSGKPFGGHRLQGISE
ncbi:unnamed protein product [Hymenolepis diminuta]|uniref:MFS domain-containing protein n=1 Tax=Hymenolepis diminuta TaxID=6216 RepID=A0A0R3SIF5_HYMDI|nr:unnamed protein product [Hymenolepis diminuta]VUZ41855.1 unnamed protein product [Hymenolepis diminuta]VUZ46332.1 unnamed protein product [Hymenolepis diminuta]VUZ47239.1 unnamed protein product [Hymenolepis diminuta]